MMSTIACINKAHKATPQKSITNRRPRPIGPSKSKQRFCK